MTMEELVGAAGGIITDEAHPDWSLLSETKKLKLGHRTVTAIAVTTCGRYVMLDQTTEKWSFVKDLKFKKTKGV
jgi:hypothetical protein